MGPLASKPRILVVDDERSVRTMLRLLLMQRYEVILADSGNAALRILAKEARSISLVLLDRIFPAGTLKGEQTLQLIHERWPDLLVIMLTVDYQVPAAVQCAHLGAFRYVNKMPNLRETVLPAVEEAMSLVRLRQETDRYEQEVRQRRQRESAMRIGLTVPEDSLQANADPDRVRDFELVRRDHWVYAYRAYQGNLSQAARSLHVSYDTYRDKLIEWGVHAPTRRRGRTESRNA
jgi:DNA-binding NtrC family response regulator